MAVKFLLLALVLYPGSLNRGLQRVVADEMRTLNTDTKSETEADDIASSSSSENEEDQEEYDPFMNAVLDEGGLASILKQLKGFNFNDPTLKVMSWESKEAWMQDVKPNMLKKREKPQTDRQEQSLTDLGDFVEELRGYKVDLSDSPSKVFRMEDIKAAVQDMKPTMVTVESSKREHSTEDKRPRVTDKVGGNFVLAVADGEHMVSSLLVV